MEDLSKKRGRKTKENEEIDKIGCVRYKCPYKACCLEYQSSLGYKRHLMYYKHSLFAPSERKIVCSYAGCRERDNLREHILAKHEEDAGELTEALDIMIRTCDETEEADTLQAENDIVHDEGLLDISRVMEEDGVIKNVILSTFPKGVTEIIDFKTFSDSNQIFYCRIPGCGRQFKSLMAYKYHCGKFTHTFKSIVDRFVQKHGPLEYAEVKEAFKRKFNLENRFLLEGVSHHLMRMPDQYYNFIFTFDDVQMGQERRRSKRREKGALSEFGVSHGDEKNEEDEEEDVKKFKDNDEEDAAFKINGIILNGRKISKTEESARQGRLALVNLQTEITCMSNIDKCAVVGTRGAEEDRAHREMVPHNPFSFSAGSGTFYILENMKVVQKQTVEGFGFPRKIVSVGQRKVLCLFNDGTIREISFSPAYKIATVRKLETKGASVDFVVFKNMVITCNHRYLNNITNKAQRSFESPVVSMGVTSESVLALDSNGKTYVLSGALEDIDSVSLKIEQKNGGPKGVPSKVGTTLVQGLGAEHDLIFMSNSLYGLGRIHSLRSNETVLVSPHASSNAILIKPGYVISSGLDGSLCVSSYDTRPKVYMKIIRAEIKGDLLHLTTADEERILNDQEAPPAFQDYRTCVQGVIAIKNSLVSSFTCGLVIQVEDFFREPPMTVPSVVADGG